MLQLQRHEGVWAGANAFRLMPGDEPASAPMRATISSAAGGQLTQIAYTWSHADDGEQDGLLVLGPGGEPGAVAAFWGDSWHQGPEPRTLLGTTRGAVVTVGYAYSGDWRWEVEIDASDPDALALTMRNIVPASAARDGMAPGPYAAMHAVLRRAA